MRIPLYTNIPLYIRVSQYKDINIYISRGTPICRATPLYRDTCLHMVAYISVPLCIYSGTPMQNSPMPVPDDVDDVCQSVLISLWEPLHPLRHEMFAPENWSDIQALSWDLSPAKPSVDKTYPHSDPSSQARLKGYTQGTEAYIAPSYPWTIQNVRFSIAFSFVDNDMLSSEAENTFWCCPND